MSTPQQSKLVLPGSWTPAMMPGLVWWLDASSISLGSGDAVSSWTDMSGNGRTMTQVNGSNQPTLIANAIGNRPAVRFGGSHGLENTTATLPLLQHTVIAVWVEPSAQTDKRLLSVNGAGNLDWYPNNGFIITTGGTTFSASFGGNNQNGGFYLAYTPAGPTALGIYINVCNGSAGQLYRNGNLVNQLTGKPPFAASGAGGIAIGKEYGGTQAYFSGDVAEIIWSQFALSDSDRRNVELYLAHKYAISV